VHFCTNELLVLQLFHWLRAMSSLRDAEPSVGSLPFSWCKRVLGV
jgi:hypothetical protein